MLLYYNFVVCARVHLNLTPEYLAICDRTCRKQEGMSPPPFFLIGGGGGNGMFVPPSTFNPTFFFPLELYVYIIPTIVWHLSYTN